MKMAGLCILLMACFVTACASDPPAPSPDDPLTGTWMGEWGTEQRRERVELRLQWDGSALEGSVNPRAENLDIDNAAYNASTGELSFEFDAYDDGKPVRYQINGKVDSNSLTGTWRRDGQQGDFEVKRGAR